MVIEAFGQALQNFGSVTMWLLLTAAVMIGLIFGIIPGIGGMLALALFLPFVFLMTPKDALPFLIAMNTASITAGSITAILLNVPGTSINAATLLDGYPMTQKGEAGRAIGAALASSGLGGSVTVLLALVMIPLILPMVMGMTSADMVFVILVGISFIAVLGTGSMVKGLVSGGLGLMLSFVGYHIITGIPRFTFGSLFLYDGINLLPIILGLFAISEVITLAVSGGTIAKAGVVIKGMQEVWEGAKDVLRHWGVWLRSTILGYFIGIIPGIGASAGTFIAYGLAKQTSKHPEEFGTGRVEGVIAPESCNNAKEAGALLTTLALGIPGSPIMAILLGAFILLGLTPGPDMLTKHLDLSLTMFLLIIVTNIMAVVICFPAAQYLVKVASVPSRFLVPFVLSLAIIGVYVYRELFGDVIVALIFGGLGVLMGKFGFSRPALILGFILGRLFEKYLFIALATAGPLFFVRPISLALIFIIIALFTFGPIKSAFQRWRRVRQA